MGPKKTPRSSRGAFPGINGVYALDFEQLEQADLSAFLASHALHALPSLQAVHSVLAASFLAEQPQLSQANAEAPVIISAIAAILIILFMG